MTTHGGGALSSNKCDAEGDVGACGEVTPHCSLSHLLSAHGADASDASGELEEDDDAGAARF